MNISVFGLGYVGCVTAACLARQGHTVVCVDIEQHKIDLINAGSSPVIEEGLSALIVEGVRAGRLCATSSATEAVLRTDLTLVCVGTPSNQNGSLRLEFTERVTTQIGDALRQKRAYHLVTFRSTVLPGTVEDLLLPILARRSGREPDCDFGVAFHPEFLREGSALRDFQHPPKIVIGQRTAASGDFLCRIYPDPPTPVIRTSIHTAEAVKYVDNLFHALKVTFANEVGNTCKALGVDSHEVIRIFCQDRQLNLSPAYLQPGFAFGGSCLPKDLRAFVYEARTRDVKVPLLEAISISNDQQKARALQLVRQTGKRRIGVLGLSFKAGTDDLRESPAVELVEGLLGKGYHVAVYDPNVYLAGLFGANKAYIERELPHIALLLRESLDEVLRESEVVVVTNRNPEFARVLTSLGSDQILIDLVHLPDGSSPSCEYRYVGISW